VVNFIIRDFETDLLKSHEAFLEEIVKQVIAKFPGATYEFEVKEQYRNMKEILQHHPQVTAYAVEAIKRAGLKPIQSSIRGGTDGSRLSFMGLPCPNIFAGEHAFHSKLEWVSVQDMHRAVDTIVHLAGIWEENS
jgi:tripeptide aminopeptidase